jgi:hypothetical protein
MAKKIIDVLDFRLGDDGPERLAGDVGQHTKRFLAHFLQDR